MNELKLGEEEAGWFRELLIRGSPLPVCAGPGGPTVGAGLALRATARGRSPVPRLLPGVGSPASYLKVMHELLGLDLDVDGVLGKFALQHLLIGQPEGGLAAGPHSDMDGELLHRSP